MKIEILNKNIKRIVLLFLCLASFNVLKSQNEPSWLKQSWRTEQYPSNVFITGFAQDEKNTSESISEATERLKDLARTDLSESILASVKSVSENYTQSIIENGSENFKEDFKYETKISTDLEINGIRVESYVNDNMVYGFAFANKYEIIGYYKANLNLQVQQIEGFINTALELEKNKEKNKAKEEFNKALPVFTEVTKSQGILSAVDKNITDEDLKMQKTMKLYNDVVQANARLAQGIIVYIVAEEDLFGNNTISIENNLKAILAENGCRFTKDESEADWKVIINTKSREYNFSNNVYFSYVDAEVKLFKAPSDKHVYQNEFTKKGAHSKSYKDAAEKAYNEISNPISEKILIWINN
ncbi:MAG: hypothetical protein JEY96_14050 [Bacteroidales bacterium]|nr:hypothetical protein [Bacteroidales bacterium]